MIFFKEMSTEEYNDSVERGRQWDLFFDHIANDGFFATIINYWNKKRHFDKMASYIPGDDEYIFEERYKFWDFMTEKERGKYERFLASAEITRGYYNNALNESKKKG